MVTAKKTRRRSPARTSYHHGDLARALREAALAIITSEGIDRFTLREAARRVGVTHRAAYRHFEDKRSLLAAVAEEGFTELLEAGRAELERNGPGDPTTRLLALAHSYLRFARSHPAHYAVMFGPRLNEDGRFPSLEVPVAAAFGLLEDELRRGMQSGRFRQRDVRDAAIALWASMHGLASLILMGRVRVRKERLEEYVGRTLGIAIHGLER